ncbi:MAG TPA: hypothetical protein VNK04_24020, partial [Gemmataceae bacterium]|nr:hypothetical protein [Gemmataceae bacterium]
MRTYLFIATLMGAWFLTVGSASAEIISAQLPYDQFGHLSNQGASCAATAVANSFRFLENRYPGIYDQRLTGDPNDPNSLAAARDRIRDGWQTGTNPPRPGMGCGPSPDVFWATKIQYIEDFAPGTTAFAGQFAATFFNLAAGTNFDINNFDQRGSIRDLPPT